MRYRYELDDQNIVRIWDDENPNENGAPFFYQPDHPDARPWVDRAEAQAWLDNFIAGLTSPVEE